MMEEFGSDGKRASENHHIQEPRQKRSCSVLRECEGGSSSVAHSDVPRVCKKMRGADHGEIHVDDKRYASGQHDMGLDGRATRNWFNHMHCGITMRQRSTGHVSNKVSSSGRLCRRSAMLLNVASSDNDDDEVVRDGPKWKKGESTKQQSKTTLAKSSLPEQRPTQSCSQPECSNQFTHARQLKPFMHCSGAPQREWERIGEHCQHSHGDSFMASKQLCIAQSESCASRQFNSQSDGLDKCFKSPTQSQSGSPNTTRSSERLILKDSQQEMESNIPFFNLIRPRPIGYYRVEGTTQWMRPSNTLVAGMDSAILRQDPLSLSGQGSGDHLSEVSIHSLETEARSSSTRNHSGDVMETAASRMYYHPSLEQNQLPSTSDIQLPLSMKLRGSSTSCDNVQQENKTIPGTCYPPSQGQHRSMSSDGTPRKTLSECSDESFYSTESHHKTDDTVLTSLDPLKTKITYEESLSEGLENHYTPDLS